MIETFLPINFIILKESANFIYKLKTVSNPKKIFALK